MPRILIKKELSQNSIIYIVPYLFVIFIWIIRLRQTGLLTPPWVEILAAAIPLALAGAYGLQAFDLEENGQTRDFLLTKPLSVTQIIYSKFGSSLFLLMPFTLLWLYGLNPDYFLLPDLLNPGSLWLIALLLITLTTYAVSFTTGLLIKGPVKLLFALIAASFFSGWILYLWSQFLTLIFYLQLAEQSLVFLLLLSILTLSLAVLIIMFSLKIARWSLCRTSFDNYREPFLTCLLSLFLFPVGLTLICAFVQPAIRPFNNLLASFFKTEEWFIAQEGLKQPGGKLFALVDGHSQIGLSEIGAKPKIIFKGAEGNDNDTPIFFCWSPDGKKIAFSFNHRIMIYSLKNQKTLIVGEGDFPLWADNGDYLLSESLIDTPKNLTYPVGGRRNLKITLIDLIKNSKIPLGNLTVTGTSLYWNSSHNRLLAVDNDKNLKLINFDGTITSLNLGLPQFSTIFFSKILATNSPSNLKILLCCFNHEDNGHNLKKYDTYLFTFNIATQRIIQNAVVKKVNYKDIIYVNDREMLVKSSKNGIYRRLRISREGNGNVIWN